MKMMKKFLAAAAVLLIGCAASFALDLDSVEIVDFEKIDNISRSDFEDMFEGDESDAFLQDLKDEFESGAEELTLAEFFLMDEDSMDEEEDVVQSLVVKKILSSRPAKNDTFISFIMREAEEDSVDGWIVLSHYINKNDVESYFIYFAAEL